MQRNPLCYCKKKRRSRERANYVRRGKVLCLAACVELYDQQQRRRKSCTGKSASNSAPASR